MNEKNTHVMDQNVDIHPKISNILYSIEENISISARISIFLEDNMSWRGQRLRYV